MKTRRTGLKSCNKIRPLNLIYAGIILVSAVIGVLFLAIVDDSYKNQLLNIVGGYVNSRTQQTFATIFTSACSMNIFLTMILMFCGYCSVSIPLIWCIASFKGLGYGITTAMVYSIYGSNAFWYINMLIFPNALLSTIIIINSCRETTISCSTQWKSVEKSKEQIGEYNFKIIRNIAFLAISGLLEASLFSIFGSFFNL